MNSTVNLSLRYVESDYVHAYRAHYASRLNLRWDIFIIAAILSFGIWSWQSPISHWLGVAFVGFAALCSFMLIAAFTVIPSMLFRSEPRLRDEYLLVFSADGIYFRTTHIDALIQWNMYSRALVDAHSYLLYHGSRQFTLIPKRVFESSEQQQTFEQLLTQHVSEIVRRDT